MLARRQIPVAGPNRLCTRIAKVERFESWLHDSYPGQTVEVWIGFEAGEEARAARDPNTGTGGAHHPRRLRAGRLRAYRKNRFPLMEWRVCRCRCEALVRAAGFPVPRKSACVFCPYGTRGDWKTLARELPAQFQAVAELEASKPPTRKGIKLSIMGFRTLRDRATGLVVGHSAPSLREFIQRPYIPKQQPCSTCGAAQRATKATRCSYLDDAVDPAIPPSSLAP